MLSFQSTCMTTVEREVATWTSATVDFVLAILVFTVAFYPVVSLGNAVLGSPVSDGTVTLVVGVLAVGGAYPVVSGEWSLGRLGEYVFVATAAAFGWGLLGLVVILVSGVSLAGSNPVPQALVWAAASFTAYILVYRTQVTVFR